MLEDGGSPVKWEKKGLVFCPSGTQWWAKSYAVFPTVDELGEGRLRIYFASLDEHRFGRIGAVEVLADDPTRVIASTDVPLLDLGEVGAFDDAGVNPFSVVNFRGRKHLYYIGWQRTQRAPYQIFIGLALSGDGGRSFKRYARVPVMDRVDDDPLLRSSPWVLAQGGGLRMWYVSGLRWVQEQDGLRYRTVIRHATSVDGVSWTASPGICVEPELEGEHGVGRPSVLFDGKLYRMWYSARSRPDQYKIGYAESADGLVWKRMDDRAGIGKSDSGWDSEMVCYPYVMRVRRKLLMFYNGNQHGATGFGCAETDDACP